MPLTAASPAASGSRRRVRAPFSPTLRNEPPPGSACGLRDLPALTRPVTWPPGPAMPPGAKRMKTAKTAPSGKPGCDSGTRKAAGSSGQCHTDSAMSRT